MRNLGRLLAFVRPYGWQAALSLGMLTALVGMDLAIPRLIQHIVDEGIAQHDRDVVIRTASVMLVISLISLLVAIANNAFSVRVGEGVARDLREAVFLKIQRYSFGNLDRQKTGELLVRLTSDVAAVKSLTQITLRIGTRAPLLIIGSVWLMARTSPQLAAAMVPLLVVTSALIGLFVVGMEPLFRTVQQRRDVVNEVLHDNIAGARLVKALVRATHEEARFDDANEQLTRQSIVAMRVMSFMSPALTLCINLGMVVVLWVGGRESMHGDLSLGQLVAFSNYLVTTMTPLVMMTMLSSTWAAGLASLRRLGEILDSVPDVADAPDAVVLATDAPATVAFEDVSFAYGPGEAVLRAVKLAATPGQTIAILGSTGAGKSTLVNLIPRFYDVPAGAVRVGGQDVRTVTQRSLAARVGFVPQATTLFSGTVRDNIRYGRPDATEAEVVAAARIAQADGFIDKLPDGYDSRVEQRGANLSGGQQQRLAIARAVLIKPRILVLDDSTSAVDVETEAHIRAALAETRADRTTFVVAQRISSVLDADVILVLDKGQIVAEGDHAQLMATSAIYREIYDSQLGGGVPS